MSRATKSASSRALAAQTAPAKSDAVTVTVTTLPTVRLGVTYLPTSQNVATANASTTARPTTALLWGALPRSTTASEVQKIIAVASRIPSIKSIQEIPPRPTLAASLSGRRPDAGGGDDDLGDAGRGASLPALLPR